MHNYRSQNAPAWRRTTVALLVLGVAFAIAAPFVSAMMHVDPLFAGIG